MSGIRGPSHSLPGQLLYWVGGALFLFTLIGSSQPWAQNDSERVVHTIDFASQPSGDASSWLEERGFELRIDTEGLTPHFSSQGLVLETPGQTTGLFTKHVHLPEARRVRISWGVDRYPHGVDWEQGVYRVPIAVMVYFGEKEIDGGSFFLPDVPYFISLFLSRNAREGKAYTAEYYLKGGRYFCQPCNAPAGETVTTEFDLAQAFKSQFNKTEVPPITGFAFQVNTKDTDGGARAFLKKVDFLSD